MDRFKLLVGLALLFLTTEASVQRFAIEPQDQIALVNSRVILPCRVSDKVGDLQWTKDDFGLGVDRNLSAWERYTMIGNQARGDYYLEIYPVMLEDDGKYQCQVSPASDYDQEIRSNFATLTVMVPPEPPRIVQGKYLVAYELLEIRLECISYGSRPAASMKWMDNYGNQLTRGLNYTVQVLPDGKRFLIKSSVTITPTMKERNTTFTCQTQNAAERTPQIAGIKLEVRYPPYVTVSILSGTASNGFIPEGADVRLGCHAEANPPAFKYQWFINGKIIDSNFTTELLLKNVTRQKYHNATVKCKVFNKHGKSEEGEILYISTGPHFRNKPQSVLADVGETVTLCCDVVGTPLPNITWIHSNSSKIVAHNANLTLRININNAGRYKCKAHVVGFTDIEAEATIFLKGLPNIISSRTQFGVEGDTVGVECTAHSIPAPMEVLWTSNHTKVQGDEYTVLEEPLPEGIKSTLIIRKSQERHFGLYSCIVRNSYGLDILEINLKTEEKFSFMLIANIGIAAVVIFSSVLIVIAIFWYRRSRSRALVNVDINIIENQLRDSNACLNTSASRLESKINCSQSNPPESETGNQSVLPKTEFHQNGLQNTYLAIDNCGLDNWPPVRNPNYIPLLPDPPLQLGALESINFFSPSSSSAYTQTDIPCDVAMDPRFNKNSDLLNLKVGLPPSKKPKVPKKPSYVKTKRFKNRLQTIYE